mmetsp:Transcript_43340/g.107637  ORF Transcript_43340/g.107637 Transcript_43340/m.107637 type:complete len:88 (+) Transcript_43340:22-285(+)
MTAPPMKVVWPLPSKSKPHFVPRGIDFDTLACPEAPPRQAALGMHAPLTAESASAHRYLSYPDWRQASKSPVIGNGDPLIVEMILSV